MNNYNNRMGPWPMYFFQREAVCHACGKHLRDLSPTRNAPGSGQYRGQCPECNRFTWYDCAEDAVNLYQIRESREGKNNCCGLCHGVGEVGDICNYHKLVLDGTIELAESLMPRLAPEFAPIQTRRSCVKCGYLLGLQNPGDTCGTCKTQT